MIWDFFFFINICFPPGGGEAGFVFSCLLNQATGLKRADTLAIFSLSLSFFFTRLRCCFITFQSLEGSKKDEHQRESYLPATDEGPRRCCELKIRFISLFEGRKCI